MDDLAKLCVMHEAGIKSRHTRFHQLNNKMSISNICVAKLTRIWNFHTDISCSSWSDLHFRSWKGYNEFSQNWENKISDKFLSRRQVLQWACGSNASPCVFEHFVYIAIRDLNEVYVFLFYLVHCQCSQQHTQMRFNVQLLAIQKQHVIRR